MALQQIDQFPDSASVHHIFSRLNNPSEYNDPNLIHSILTDLEKVGDIDLTYFARSATIHIFSIEMERIGSKSLKRAILQAKMRALFESVNDHYTTEISTGVRAGITSVLADRIYLSSSERLDYGVRELDDIDHECVEENITRFKEKLAANPEAIKLVLLNGGLGFARIMNIQDYFSLPASATEELMTTTPKIDSSILEQVKLSLLKDPTLKIFIMDDVVDTGSTLLASLIAVLKLRLSVNVDPQIADVLKLMINRAMNLFDAFQSMDITDPVLNLQHAMNMYELTQDLDQAPYNINVAVLTDKLMGNASLAQIYGEDFDPAYDVIYPSFVDDQLGNRLDPAERPWLMGFNTLDTGVGVKVFNTLIGKEEIFKVSVGRSLSAPLVLEGEPEVRAKYTDLKPFTRMQILVWNTLVNLGIPGIHIQFPEMQWGEFPGDHLAEA